MAYTTFEMFSGMAYYYSSAEKATREAGEYMYVTLFDTECYLIVLLTVVPSIGITESTLWSGDTAVHRESSKH
jgi:hypothetical protein